jgi:hypothetical protein
MYNFDNDDEKPGASYNSTFITIYDPGLDDLTWWTYVGMQPRLTSHSGAWVTMDKSHFGYWIQIQIQIMFIEPYKIYYFISVEIQ